MASTPRAARARGPDRTQVETLISTYTGRALGFMEEPVVNMLRLNLALDKR
jgi:K+-transporting ATPase ATPase C chain